MLEVLRFITTFLPGSGTIVFNVYVFFLNQWVRRNLHLRVPLFGEIGLKPKN